MFEMVMMNLRTAWGLSLADFEQKFGLPLSEVYPDAVPERNQAGLAQNDGEPPDADRSRYGASKYGTGGVSGLRNFFSIEVKMIH